MARRSLVPLVRKQLDPIDVARLEGVSEDKQPDLRKAIRREIKAVLHDPRMRDFGRRSGF